MISFGRRVAGRIDEYLTNEGLTVLSLRQLMDLFLPFSHPVPVERWHKPPILRQRQFGRYLFRYALATLSTIDLGEEFKAEWDLRLHYYNYTKSDLMTFASRADRDKGASPVPKESSGKSDFLSHKSRRAEKSDFYSDEVGVSRFRDISIHFPSDVYLLAVWAVSSDTARSTPTRMRGTTLRGLAGKFVSMYGPDYEKPLSTDDVLRTFAANGITGNPVIRRDADVSIAHKEFLIP